MAPLPVYFERFVRHVWPQKPDKWDDLTDELIAAASDGDGSAYTLETAANLVRSREQAKEPEELDYFGG